MCKLQIANLHTSCPWQNSTLLKAIRVIPHSTLPAPLPPYTHTLPEKNLSMSYFDHTAQMLRLGFVCENLDVL